MLNMKLVRRFPLQFTYSPIPRLQPQDTCQLGVSADDVSSKLSEAKSLVSACRKVSTH